MKQVEDNRWLLEKVEKANRTSLPNGECGRMALGLSSNKKRRALRDQGINQSTRVNKQ